MPTTCICAQLRAWRQLYPDRLASAERNATARAQEDSWFGRFAGTNALERDQVIDLVDWKFQSMAHRRALAMRGISPERWEGQGGVADLIRQALADRDDEAALMTVCRIYRFGPAMGSVILAACRPGRFTVADSRALKALRGLGRMPAGPPGFRRGDWLPYLDACRSLTDLCTLSLREVDRALWIAAADPNLAKPLDDLDVR
jgi:hypothetical protein